MDCSAIIAVISNKIISIAIGITIQRTDKISLGSFKFNTYRYIESFQK